MLTPFLLAAERLIKFPSPIAHRSLLIAQRVLGTPLRFCVQLRGTRSPATLSDEDELANSGGKAWPALAPEEAAAAAEGAPFAVEGREDDPFFAFFEARASTAAAAFAASLSRVRFCPCDAGAVVEPPSLVELAALDAEAPAALAEGAENEADADFALLCSTRARSNAPSVAAGSDWDISTSPSSLAHEPPFPPLLLPSAFADPNTSARHFARVVGAVGSAVATGGEEAGGASCDFDCFFSRLATGAGSDCATAAESSGSGDASRARFFDLLSPAAVKGGEEALLVLRCESCLPSLMSLPAPPLLDLRSLAGVLRAVRDLARVVGGEEAPSRFGEPLDGAEADDGAELAGGRAGALLSALSALVLGSRAPAILRASSGEIGSSSSGSAGSSMPIFLALRN